VLKIVVQAGGKGTRLGQLTKNKPKCLVPIHNEPILFSLFRKYPDNEFIIIGDYKYSVLDKYLRTFSTAHYVLVETHGEGNICGIRQALTYIPDNSPFILIWSDLLLPDSFNVNNLPNDNYVGVTDDFLCSWEFKDGKLRKVPSTGNGVSGFFAFDKKDYFVSIPDEGSFVSWLHNSGITLTALPIKGCREIGDLVTLKTEEALYFHCRPYNKLEFTEDRVIKSGITNEGKRLLEYEKLWYMKMKEYQFGWIPAIYSLDPLIMEKIDGTSVFSAVLSDNQKKNISNYSA
jgi:GTP:adenosylcobinamide-phosphate guanylyltransferase